MFDHVTIRVSDRAASERFYRTVLEAVEIAPTHTGEHFAEWDDFSLAEVARPRSHQWRDDNGGGRSPWLGERAVDLDLEAAVPRRRQGRLVEGGKRGVHPRERMLLEEVEELKAALGEAHVELRVWKRSAEHRLGPTRTSR